MSFSSRARFAGAGIALLTLASLGLSAAPAFAIETSELSPIAYADTYYMPQDTTLTVDWMNGLTAVTSTDLPTLAETPGPSATVVAPTPTELDVSIGVLAALLVAVGAMLLVLRRRTETWR